MMKMTERERLIELLDKVNLWDDNDYIVDYLLQNGVIVPPCKVGDTVWYIKTLRDGKGTDTKAVSDGEKIKQISINNHGMFLVVGYCQMLDCEDFGKTVFLTREESEKALKEREENA